MVACPKCRASGECVVLHEIANGNVLEFSQRADGTIDPEGVLIHNGDPVRVTGVCLECAHRWTLRGVRQIVNLAGHPQSHMYRPPAPSVTHGGPSGERSETEKENV